MSDRMVERVIWVVGFILLSVICMFKESALNRADERYFELMNRYYDCIVRNK